MALESWRPLTILLTAAVAAVLLFSHHSAAAKAYCRSPTAVAAAHVVRTCSNLLVGPHFDCCGASRSFIYSCSNCVKSPVNVLQTLESRIVLRALDAAASACNFNFSQVIIQELGCLGVKDYRLTSYKKDLRR